MFDNAALLPINFSVSDWLILREKSKIVKEYNHRAGQRCFELLALIGSPQLSDMASQESTMKDVKILQGIIFKFVNRIQTQEYQ